MVNKNEPRRTVPSSHYDKKYWLTDNEGHEEFIKSSGRELSPRLQKSLELAELRGKMAILDLGCGRGEIVINCALMGHEVIGVEPSGGAAELMREAMDNLPAGARQNITLIKGDGCNLPFKDKLFDRVFMNDVVEELYPEEVDQVLIELRRCLKDDGLLIIHTMPNRWFIDIGYRYYLRYLYILLNPLAKKVIKKSLHTAKNPRGQYDYIMHVNEQTYFSLKSSLKNSGFQAKVWLNDIYVAKDLVHLLDTMIRFPVWPLKLILAEHIWAIGRPKKEGNIKK